MKTTIDCEDSTCESRPTLLPRAFWEPCCAANDACGVAGAFLSNLGAEVADACLALDQPGSVSPACPDTPPLCLSVNGLGIAVERFEGCCRAGTRTCGVLLDSVRTDLGVFAQPELGCIDSAPFFGGEPGAPCDTD
jgi:hypothetical protein